MVIVGIRNRQRRSAVCGRGKAAVTRYYAGVVQEVGRCCGLVCAVIWVVGALIDTGRLHIGIKRLLPVLLISASIIDGELRVMLIGILRVLDKGETKLLFIGQARGFAGVFADFLKDREQNGGENRDNSDNDEQLDQGEASF